MSANLHISEVTNASRTLLLDLHSLTWSDVMLAFFGLRPSILPRLVSSSETYGNIAAGPLAGVPIAGLVGDQQGALVGNKCFEVGEAKCTYGTGAFLLFNTGKDPVKSDNGMLTTVSEVVFVNSRKSYPCIYERSHIKLVHVLNLCMLSKAVVSNDFVGFYTTNLSVVAVAGSAIKWSVHFIDFFRRHRDW